jgi:hypothetical protein
MGGSDIPYIGWQESERNFYRECFVGDGLFKTQGVLPHRGTPAKQNKKRRLRRRPERLSTNMHSLSTGENEKSLFCFYRRSRKISSPY